MKKIALFIVFLLTILFLNPAQAVADDNTFSCRWQDDVIGCKVEISLSLCNPGFDSDPSVCESIDEQGECNGTINISCVGTTPITCFECVSAGNCQPTTNQAAVHCTNEDEGCDYQCAYDQCFDACTSPPGQMYRCDSNSGCVKDNNGSLLAQDCADQCQLKFTCTSDYSCVVSADGEHQSMEDCAEECIEGEAEKVTLLQPVECCMREIPNPWAMDCPEEDLGIETALGCFPTDTKATLQWIVKYSSMFGGGTGFLIMLFASILIMTAGGDPEKLKNAQQLLAAAITGILIIVFALFLLRFIGWDILRLPGWAPKI